MASRAENSPYSRRRITSSRDSKGAGHLEPDQQATDLIDSRSGQGGHAGLPGKAWATWS